MRFPASRCADRSDRSSSPRKPSATAPCQQNAEHPVTADRLIGAAALCWAETADLLWESRPGRSDPVESVSTGMMCDALYLGFSRVP